MAFLRIDDIAGHRANNLARLASRNKNTHRRQALPKRLGRQHRIEKRLTGIAVAVCFKCILKTFQNAAGIAAACLPYREW